MSIFENISFDSIEGVLKHRHRGIRGRENTVVVKCSCLCVIILASPKISSNAVRHILGEEV